MDYEKELSNILCEEIAREYLAEKGVTDIDDAVFEQAMSKADGNWANACILYELLILAAKPIR